MWVYETCVALVRMGLIALRTIFFSGVPLILDSVFLHSIHQFSHVTNQ